MRAAISWTGWKYKHDFIRFQIRQTKFLMYFNVFHLLNKIQGECQCDEKWTRKGWGMKMNNISNPPKAILRDFTVF